MPSGNWESEPGGGMRHDDTVQILVEVVAGRRVHEEAVRHETRRAAPVIRLTRRHELREQDVA